MSTNEEVLFPKALVLPTTLKADQSNSAPAGSICISGAMLAFHNGTSWKYIAGT
jgi:hypothetical protein